MKTKAFASNLLAVVAAAALAQYLGGCRAGAVAAPPQDEARTAPLAKTITVRESPVIRALPITGTLRPHRQAAVAANTTGRVLRAPIERGEVISAGAPLAVVDTRMADLTAREARAAAAMAAAQEASTKRERERLSRLFAQGAITETERDRAADAHALAAHAAEAAATRAAAAAQAVADGVIRAPFTGVVVERHVEVGEFLRPDTKVATLVKLDPLRLELTVPEASLGCLKDGAKVTFRVAAAQGRTFEGTIRFVGAVVRDSSRDVVAEALVPNRDRRLRAGMFAAVDLPTEAVAMPVVPERALVARDGRLRALVVTADGVEERLVEAAPAREGLVPIIAGLRPGERILEHPAELDNQLVR